MRNAVMLLTVLLACGWAPSDVMAQTLAQRVAGADATAVRMSFPAHAGVCAGGFGVYDFERGSVDWRADCEAGPIRVQLEIAAGAVTRLATYVGGTWVDRAGVTDLGNVPAQTAADYLLELARTAPAQVAGDALNAAVLADAADPWPALLALARAAERPVDVRKRAAFWLGQSAAREATRGLAALVDADDTEIAVQKAAVFALARRDEPARFDELARIARTHGNAEIVKAALFWLAQSPDPRTLDLFESILSSAPRPTR